MHGEYIPHLDNYTEYDYIIYIPHDYTSLTAVSNYKLKMMINIPSLYMEQPLLITVVCLLLVKVILQGTQEHHSVKWIQLLLNICTQSQTMVYCVLFFVSIQVTKKLTYWCSTVYIMIVHT